MARLRRIDNRGQLAKPERTPEGYLRAEAHTAKVGILEYDAPGGGTRRELVLPEDLFDPASIATARMVPLTYRHPEQLLDATTARAHQVGSVGENIRPDGELLAAPIMVTDADAVKGIEAGDQQMSWGYDCDLIETPGTHPDFGPYHAIQKRRRYNHLAIVNSARAGNQARIRLDASGNACDPFATAAPAVVASDPSAGATSSTEPSMPVQIKIGDHRFDASDAAAPLLQQEIDRVVADLRARLDAADKAKGAAEKLAAETTAKLDGYKGRVVKFTKGLRARLDAMKAKMIGCDECGGSGKVMDDAGAEGKCDYCDGAGTIRMHEAVKAMAVPDNQHGEGHPDDDMAEMGEDLDSGVPERESAAEEALETAANSDHPKLDAAGRKQRADARSTARVTARARRADSMERRATRRAAERAGLLTTAAKHLDGDALKKLDGKPDIEIKRAVVAKLAPHLDGVDKMDPATVVLHFGAECKRADAAGSNSPQLSEGDRLRQIIAGAGGSGAPPAPAVRVDANSIAASAADAKANAWRRGEAK